jgi:hypothetical protein
MIFQSTPLPPDLIRVSPQPAFSSRVNSGPLPIFVTADCRSQCVCPVADGPGIGSNKVRRVNCPYIRKSLPASPGKSPFTRRVRFTRRLHIGRLAARPVLVDRSKRVRTGPTHPAASRCPDLVVSSFKTGFFTFGTGVQKTPQRCRYQITTLPTGGHR